MHEQQPIDEPVEATDTPLESEDAAIRLYRIHYNFELSSKTPEEAQKRRASLEAFYASLTPEAVAFLDELTDERDQTGRRLAQSQLIQMNASIDARLQLERRRQLEPRIPQKPRLSAGQRKHIRRMKAQQRRRERKDRRL